MAPRSSRRTSKSSKPGKKASRTTKKPAAANPSARPRGRPRGKFPAARLAALKAAREERKALLALCSRDRVLRDADVPGPLKPSMQQEKVSRRIITRACTAKLKAYWEWIEEWAMEHMPHDPFLHQMPWKTRFIDGMEGPTYHGGGVWRSNRWMLA